MMLPQDLEAERAVLGSMLLAPEALNIGLARLTVDAFMLPEHRLILQTLAHLHKQGTAIDLVTTKNELIRQGRLEAAGGIDLLVTLAESVPSAANVGSYADILLRLREQRRLHMVGHELQQAAAAHDADPAKIALACREQLERVGNNGHNTSGPVLTCLADVEPREVSWFWPGRIPLGRITLVVGRPGEGKSFVSIDIAARVTTGSPWPDGSGCAPEGSVILISCEDDPHDVIRTRLDAHRADVQKVHLLSGVLKSTDTGDLREVMFRLQDVESLEAALKLHRDCKLIVVDPVGSFLGVGTDAHRDNEVRGVLAPVARLAEKYGPAVVVIAHRRKGTGQFADDLALGSRAFTGIARAVWHLTRDPQDKDRRLWLPGKNNLAVEGDGLAFTIGGDPPRIWWEPEPVRMTADDALADESGASENQRPGPEPTIRLAAMGWLRTVLAEGEMPVATVESEAKAAGYSWRTVQRAADGIGVLRRKCGFDGAWTWALPEGANRTRRGAEEKDNLASWHLRENEPEKAVSVPQVPGDATLDYPGTFDGCAESDRSPPEGIPPGVWRKIQARKNDGLD